MSFRVLGGAAALLLLGAAPAANARDLGTLGGDFSAAVAINEAGLVAGYATTDDDVIHAFVRDVTVGTTNQDLGTLGGSESRAIAISEAGQVVGWSDLFLNLEQHAFLYENGTMIDLGTLGGSVSMPTDINGNGQVVGWSTLPGDLVTHAFLYSGGVMMDLGTLGGSDSRANAINNAGEIAGHSDLPGDSTEHAFLWSAGSMTDLGTLGGSSSYASDINEAGDVAGSAKLPGDVAFHTFLFTGGVMEDLGTFGGTDSGAWALNDAGQVVGAAKDGAGEWQPFLWSGGVLQDIGPDDTFATALNEAGDVLLTGNDFAGSRYPDPLPSDIWVVSVSVADINDAGHVVGSRGYEPYGDEEQGYVHAHLWPGDCGNGEPDAGEQCDDGEIFDGDCCSSTCQAAAVDTLCGADNDLCTSDRCDGAGACVALQEPWLEVDCRTAEGARIRLRDGRIRWQWDKGSAVEQDDLGDPRHSTSYSLCVWDHAALTPSLAARIDVVPSTTRWTSRDPNGWVYKYSGGFGLENGFHLMKLKTGEDGRAKVKLDGDLHLPDPVVPERQFAEEPSVVVQLVSSLGLCMTSEFSDARYNIPDRYQALEDNE